LSSGKQPIYERHIGKLFAWTATVAAVVLAVLALVVGALSFAADERQRAYEAAKASPAPSESLSSPVDQNSGTSSAKPSVTVADVSNHFVGTWTGSIEYGASNPYPVEVNITRGSVDELVGTVRYLNGQCEGELKLRSATSKELVLWLNISGGQCHDRAGLKLKYDSGDSIRWDYTGAQGEETGTLTREI
jgi:hypothetical protein